MLGEPGNGLHGVNSGGGLEAKPTAWQTSPEQGVLEEILHIQVLFSWEPPK